jgi:organic hydroperoxide reductase OsmC/OhrA
MSEHRAEVSWSREGAPFTDNRFSRGHLWKFDGGIEVKGSASPQLVPVPLSVESAVDPEEALVASLSSCHMLWFLYIAAKRGYVLESYQDQAVGVMGKEASGQTSMTRVTLRPVTRFTGDRRPAMEELVAMHHEAHKQCYIANSVRSEVKCEPSLGG